MTPDLEDALVAVRRAARSLHVETESDSKVLTVGNMILLIYVERGIRGVRDACLQILEELEVRDDERRSQLRLAAADLLVALPAD